MAGTTLSGKTCLVTGGAGGLGKEISKQLLENGANVVIADINKSLLDTASQELSGKERLLAVECNIADEDSVKSLIEQTIKAYGKLDVLVNNAGIMDKFDPVGDLEKSLWDKVIAVNLTAPFLLSKIAIQHFLQRSASDAAIVNIGSLSSQGGFFAGAAYTSSKHGLLGLTKNTAAFYRKKGIRCNLIMPSGMNTNIGSALVDGMNPEGSKLAFTAGQALEADRIPLEQVARLAVFLASAESSSLSGALITSDMAFTSLF